MIFSFPIKELMLILIAVANMSIGAYVWVRKPHDRVRQSFFVFVAGSSLWIIGFTFLLLSKNFFFDKVINYGGLIGILGLFLFAQLFPRQSILRIRAWLLYAPFAIAAIGIVPWNFIVARIDILPTGGFTPIPGPLLPVWTAILCAYTVASIGIFIRNYRNTRGHERLQLRYFFLGIGVFILSAIAFDAVLPAYFGITAFNAIGPFTSIIFIGCTAYAIVRHQLLDIRVVIQRGLVFSTLLGILVAAYYVGLFEIGEIAQLSTGITAPFWAAIVMVVGIFTVPALDRYFKKITDPWFFKDTYDYSQTLSELTDILNSHNTSTILIIKTLDTLKAALRLEEVDFLLPSVLKKNNDLLQFPVRSKRQDLGVLLVGRKRSGDPFTGVDGKLLGTLAAELAIALEKAQLFEQVQSHARDLEQKVEERTRYLKELQENQKRMFSDISHALQTPLTILKGSAGRLIDQPASDVEKHARVMELSVTNVSAFIQDLLRLSRSESLPPLPHTSFDLSALVLQTTEYVETICQENGISLLYSIHEGIMFNGNEKDIKELIIILLSNAVRYTKGRSTANIRVDLTQDEDFVVLIVADTGIGIPADKLPHIYERFYRAHEGTSEHGSGLGLAIAKYVVESHAGSIEVESTEGKGTSFTVRFKYKGAKRGPKHETRP